MGARGPIGKRSDHRHGHRTKAENAVDQIFGAAPQPELGLDVHELAESWYAALADSPESQYYTPAMWERARIVAQMLSGVLRAGRPSSQMYAAIQSDMKSLLVDAGELRRLGIEVQSAESQPVAPVTDFRARLSSGA